MSQEVLKAFRIDCQTKENGKRNRWHFALLGLLKTIILSAELKKVSGLKLIDPSKRDPINKRGGEKGGKLFLF